MRKGAKLLLGVSVALITAATLHLTVGERFHKNNRMGHFHCGPGWSKYQDRCSKPVQTPHQPNEVN